MTTSNAATTATEKPTPGIRFALIHVFYAMSLLAAALATFGGAGLPLAVPILGFWAYVFFSRSRPRALGCGCLAVLVCGCLIALLLPAMGTARHAARRVMCVNNLKQIALALHNYHDVHGVFPPAFIPDKDGKPMHSWRVLLLPYVEEQRRYDKYNFQEPWDSPNNSKLLTPIPSIYTCPTDTRTVLEKRVRTSYVAVIGPRTAWPGPSTRKIGEISDGASNTVLVIEHPNESISWMEPRDLTLDEAVGVLTSPDPQAAGPHRYEDFFYEYSGGRNVAFADGSVHFLYDGLARNVWSALLTIDDGVSLSETDWSLRTEDRERLKVANCYRLAVFVLLTFFPLPWVWRQPKPAEAVKRDIDA